MNLISRNDEKTYSKLLNKLPDAPSMLYTEGNLELLNSVSIAIVGSRRASDKGKKLAQKIAFELSNIGITVVSGLARGIDTVAHTYSYNQKGKTIAVLGTGFNNIYPPDNIDLYKNIISHGGLVISELEPNTDKISQNFRERNRIISGLSLGVLVIEAKYKSGTSITADFATKQQRPVFVLPHEIDNPYGIGTNRLLKNGAIAITDTIDILNSLKLTKYKKLYQSLKSDKKNDTLKINLTDPKQSEVFRFIKKSPTTPNDLTKKTGYSINEIQSILFILELEGYIKKVPGGYICM